MSEHATETPMTAAESIERLQSASTVETLAQSLFNDSSLRMSWEEFCSWKDGEYADGFRDRAREILHSVGLAAFRADGDAGSREAVQEQIQNMSALTNAEEGKLPEGDVDELTLSFLGFDPDGGEDMRQVEEDAEDLFAKFRFEVIGRMTWDLDLARERDTDAHLIVEADRLVIGHSSCGPDQFSFQVTDIKLRLGEVNVPLDGDHYEIALRFASMAIPELYSELC